MLLTAQPAGEGAAAEVVAAAPAWGQPIRLPHRWCQSASAAGSEAAGACVTVWLSTPLGPASASIGAQHFQKALEQKEVQLTVQAQLLPPSAGSAGGAATDAAVGPRGAQGQPLQVQLHAVVRRDGQDFETRAGPLLQVGTSAQVLCAHNCRTYLLQVLPAG